MSDFQIIAIEDIFVPERLRAVEEEHALVIAQSIVEHGLINPISVRRTPARKGFKFTLIAGAHRLRAFELNHESEIEALIFEADAEEGQLLEITENLFRNELSVIDRAVFVESYRDIWEAKYGKIDRTKNLKQSKDQVDPSGDNKINLIQLIADKAPANSFAEHVANRMGVSVPSYKRLNQIAQNLHPELRAALRGTPHADNQSQLLGLVKLEPAKQKLFAAGFKESGDFDLTLKALDVKKPKPDAQTVLLERLMDTWRRSNEGTRAQFVDHIHDYLEGRSE